VQVKKAGYIAIGVVTMLVVCSSRQTAYYPDTRSKLAQVDSLTAAGNFEDAAILIERIDERLLPDSALLLRKGIIYRELDDVESRRKSAHFFRTLVERYSTTPRFWIELAQTLLAQSFDDEAKLQLKRAIELNPNDETPYLFLFDIFVSRYYINSWNSEADKAESTLQVLLRQVPKSRSGLCKLASLQAVRGRIGAALGNAQKALALDSTAVDVNLALGYIQYQFRHFERCQRHFDKAMAKMNRFDRWVYMTIECVLPPQMALEYPFWRPEVRDSVGWEFWRTRDSDPTTEINERILEHYCRVWEANLYFGTPENGGVGWRTVMGATLVRMGRPNVRRRAVVEVHRSRNEHFIDESPVWFWNYDNSEIPCSFAFLDRFMSNNYTYPIAGYDNKLAPVHQASREIAAAIFTQKPEQSSTFRTLQPITINSDIYQFRAGSGRTAALVDLTIPIKDVAFDTAAGRVKAGLAVRKALRSQDRELVWQKAGEAKLDLKIGESQPDSDVWRDLFTVESSPGVFQLALACEQQKADRFGLVDRSIEFQDFDNAIALSDLFLTSDSIVNPKPGDIWKKQYSGRVIPCKTFSPTKRLTIYFEIYNLPIDIYSQTSLQISYNLRMIKPNESGLKRLLGKLSPDKRESITMTYRESGRSRDLARATTFDVDRLRVGEYSLTIEVTDQIFNRTVSKTTTLTVIP
jgi:GWxTD domain-containing protein